MAKTSKGAGSAGANRKKQPAQSQPPAPKTVLEIILEWSLDRPQWQRDALRRIVTKASLDEADIEAVVSLCKREHGDASVTLAPLPLERNQLPANAISSASIALTSISEVVGVNQLASAQTLIFAPTGITVVYGDNGAGKSGYARILKRACKARQPGEIARNAFDPNAPAPSASIAFTSAGTVEPPVKWMNEPQPHPVLSAIAVFDRDSGAVHVREKNEVAFRPFGLDIPDDLAAVCQRVKDALIAEQTEADRKRDGIFAKPTWSTISSVGRILSSLTAASDLSPLTSLAVISEGERNRFQQLVEDLAKDPMKAAAEQLLFADETRTLATRLDQIEQQNNDAAFSALLTMAEAARSKRDAVDVAAKTAFGMADLAGVGSGVWQSLWTAARRYAEEGAYPGKPFPLPDNEARCVLCHQNLDTAARARLQGFEDFVRADTERQARQAEDAFAAGRKRFDAQRLKTSDFIAIQRRIALADGAIARTVRRFIATARLRRRVCDLHMAGDTARTMTPLTPRPTNELAALEAKTRAYAEQLRNAANADGRKNLEQERDELADRINLETYLPKAEAELDRLKTLALIAKALPSTNTNQITKLGNDIADQIITPKIRDRFQSEIVGLAANRVRVEIVRSGGKFGSPQYQIRFFANANARVHTVLSEGEQTCVAMAAFLTELATAHHNSALVFDDPVTSLDHRWRKRVAQRLVAEAGQRQVIVFTHDLVFVHDLKDFADAASIPAKLLTVSRGPSGAGLVADGLPWRGTNIKDRVDKLEKEVREAKIFFDAQDEEGYRERAFKIYNGLRSTWERAIEDVAFHGVILRHRDYVNTKFLRKATALIEADCDTFEVGFKKCCDQTDAHDPSRSRNDEPPPPDEMLKDVRTVLDWVNSIRERQKAIA